MAWIYLLIAAVLEMVWALGLKYTDGFTKIVPSVITVIAMAISFFCLALSLRSIPIGTAYAIWTGLGAAGVAVIGMIFLNESTDIFRIISIGLILLGIVGIKFSHYA